MSFPAPSVLFGDRHVQRDPDRITTHNNPLLKQFGTPAGDLNKIGRTHHNLLAASLVAESSASKYECRIDLYPCEANKTAMPISSHVGLMRDILLCNAFVRLHGTATTADYGGYTLPTPCLWGTSAQLVAFDHLHAVVRKAAVAARGPSNAAKRRVERIAKIQSAFALPLRVLADVLDRSPTQIYKWLDVNEELDLQEASQRRLDSIEGLANRWLSYSSTPLGALRKEQIGNGKTIVDILAEDTIDPAAAEVGFKLLAERQKDEPRTLTQRLRDRGFKPVRRTLPDDD